MHAHTQIVGTLERIAAPPAGPAPNARNEAVEVAAEGIAPVDCADGLKPATLDRARCLPEDF